MTLFLADRVGELAPLQAAWLPGGCAPRDDSGRLRVSQPVLRPERLSGPAGAALRAGRQSAAARADPAHRRLARRRAAGRRPARIVDTLLDEFAAAPSPMPCRCRPTAGCAHRGRTAEESCGLSIEEWGGRVGASGRTLARLFIAETGLSFTRWRTQCRLLLARARLAEGESVTTVAHAMGYASDSAFIAMHRRVYGESPARLWRQSAEQAEAVAASAPRRPQPAQPYCP